MANPPKLPPLTAARNSGANRGKVPETCFAEVQIVLDKWGTVVYIGRYEAHEYLP